MYQIRFRLAHCPRLRWGGFCALPNPLAGFRGPTGSYLEGDREQGNGYREQKGTGRRREGMGILSGYMLPPEKFLATLLDFGPNIMHG